jgi:hypothetical protein
VQPISKVRGIRIHYISVFRYYLNWPWFSFRTLDLTWPWFFLDYTVQRRHSQRTHTYDWADASLNCVGHRWKDPSLVLVIKWQPMWINVFKCEIHRWLVHRYICVSNICHVGENGSEMLQSSHMWWRSSLHMRHDIESCD